MKTIYAISQGSYSDYGVKAVFEDEATAQKWADTMNVSDKYDDYRVESFTLVPSGTEPFKVTIYQKSATLNDDGTITGEREWHNTSWAIDTYLVASHRPTIRYVRAPCHNGIAGRVDIHGTDLHAIRQAMSDKIAAWKAGVWGGPKFAEINEGGDE